MPAAPPTRRGSFTTRPVYMGRRGVLASGHYLAARAGQRIFDVTIEGATVIDNLDIVSQVGANTALLLTRSATVSDGVLNIAFITVVDNAKLSALQVTAAGGGSNQPPVVSAGADQTITLPASANLSGTATDDGLPNPPATLTTTWSMLVGPGAVKFGNPNALSTTASFSTAGTYTLRLTASDSALTAVDDVLITVNPSGSSFTPIRINAGGGSRRQQNASRVWRNPRHPSRNFWPAIIAWLHWSPRM